MGKIFDSLGPIDGIKIMVGLVVAFFASLPVVFKCLLIMMGLDVIAGLIVHAQAQDVASKAYFRGVTRKALVLIIVMATEAVSRALGIQWSISVVVAGAYVVHELVSIVENAAAAGLWIPPILLEFIKKAEKKVGIEDRAD